MSQKSSGAEFIVVLNPGSGSQDKGEARAVIEEVFRAAGRPYRVLPMEGRELRAVCQEAARLAAACGGVLVSVGGDGTLSTAAQAAYANDCPLAVVAQGTFNIFAREHGLPLDVREAVELLLQSQPREIQVGLVNQQVFIANASLGLYPKVLDDREGAKEKLGRKQWVAKLAGLATLLKWRLNLRLDCEMDGVQLRVVTASLFVSNNRLQLERLGIDESALAQLGHGRLAGIAARPRGVWAKLRLAFDAAIGRLGDAPEVRTFTWRSLTVAMRHARRIRVALDGEVRWMQLPLRIAVAPKKLRVLLPPIPAAPEN